MERKIAKKVDFGYDNSLNPNGSFEGIGLTGKGIGPISGEFIGVINVNNNNYLVTKIINSYKDECNGKIDVRKSLADLYADGSGILYIDQRYSNDCQELEKILNSKPVKNALLKGINIKDVFPSDFVPFSFDCVTKSNNIIATAIKHEVFEGKRNLISNCHNSISSMQQEIEKNYEKISNRSL